MPGINDEVARIRREQAEAARRARAEPSAWEKKRATEEAQRLWSLEYYGALGPTFVRWAKKARHWPQRLATTKTHKTWYGRETTLPRLGWVLDSEVTVTHDNDSRTPYSHIDWQLVIDSEGTIFTMFDHYGLRPIITPGQLRGLIAREIALSGSKIPWPE